MKRKVNFKLLTLLVTITLELGSFLVLFFVTKDHTLVSNVFFGISAFFLVLILCQYLLFKRAIKQDKRNKIKQEERELQKISKVNKRRVKSKQNTFKEEDVDADDKNRINYGAFFLIIPFFLSLIISLIMAFV